MKSYTIRPIKSLKGDLSVPGDKSHSHRALILSSLAQGTSTIHNLLLAEDVLATMRILQQLGIKMSHQPHELKPGDVLQIEGRGFHGLKPSQEILDCGNSGTSMRLLMGLLAAQPFDSVLTGDDSLNKRPMDRVINPLTQMGAEFSVSHNERGRLITIHGNKKLNGKKFILPVASAQVKSAILLAGLYARGKTIICEPAPSRDHTERMMQSMGIPLDIEGLTFSLSPQNVPIKPLNLSVPNDFSSAAFFIVGALITKNSEVCLTNICMNPTRAALKDVLLKMGGSIEIRNKKSISGEEVADLVVKGSRLRGARISGELIPKLIDEIPIFSIAASQAYGMSEVSDAQELRVKESDRIATLSTELKKMGVSIQEKDDGFMIKGPAFLNGGVVDSYGDHRIAMSLAIAGLVSKEALTVQNIECVNTSFPSFFTLLESLID